MCIQNLGVDLTRETSRRPIVLSYVIRAWSCFLTSEVGPEEDDYLRIQMMKRRFFLKYSFERPAQILVSLRY